MYNNPYIANYNPNLMQQNFNDRIDNEIAKLQQMKNGNMQQPAINQTFQLAPTSNIHMKFANTIDDVNKETVFVDTPYFSKDMSVMWLKSAKGDIKTFELKEIIPLDEKDIKIQYLEEQIEELRKEVKKNEHNANVDPRFDEQDTTKDDESNGNAIENEKSTSIQRVSTSKKK